MTGAELRDLLDTLTPEQLALDVYRVDEHFLSSVSTVRAGMFCRKWGVGVEADAVDERAAATPVLILE